MNGITMLETAIRSWYVFSAEMAAESTQDPVPLVRRRLDRMVEEGRLGRWSQYGHGLPDVYYPAR